jgi:hypothetical protein
MLRRSMLAGRCCPLGWNAVRDLFLDFDLEAGMLDEVDDEVRELLGNEARFC